MKVFKSIKWRLQIWYGLILVSVLAGFGVAAYQLERGRQLRRVDDGLQQRMGFLANALRRPPHRGESPGRPPFDGPAPGQFSGQFPEDGLPNGNPPRRESFHLPPEAAGFFDTNDANGFYFVIHGRDGREIARSANAPKMNPAQVENPSVRDNDPPQLPENDGAPRYDDDGRLAPDENVNSPKAPVPAGQPAPSRMRGSYLEMTVNMPFGGRILVGKNISPELKELHRAAFNLTAIGGLILLVGLAGGWWLVSRALNPISGISATATKISAGDLSQRINVAEAESELGQLATVLNSTFARLETAFAQQKQFASDAAHELRTPVSVILTQTQLALNRERDAAGYKQTVEACQRAAQRMRRLIESLLELARFDAGQEILKRMRFDFSRTVLDSADMVQALADERGVKLSVEAGPLEIKGDSERLGQVVTNLLMNAIQYNRSEGEVRVTLDSQDGLAVLTVADTGQGIAAEDLPHVFDRFYRADQSRTGAGSSGLGLAICKAIVEAHGGIIDASSEANAGTIFTVRLPV